MVKHGLYHPFKSLEKVQYSETIFATKPEVKNRGSGLDCKLTLDACDGMVMPQANVLKIYA